MGKKEKKRKMGVHKCFMGREFTEKSRLESMVLLKTEVAETYCRGAGHLAGA